VVERFLVGRRLEDLILGDEAFGQEPLLLGHEVGAFHRVGRGGAKAAYHDVQIPFLLGPRSSMYRNNGAANLAAIGAQRQALHHRRIFTLGGMELQVALFGVMAGSLRTDCWKRGLLR